MNYNTPFAVLGYQESDHSEPIHRARIVNPASRNDASIGMKALRESFSNSFSGAFKNSLPTEKPFININGTTIIDGTSFTKEQLVSKLKSSDKSFVWFYAHWCGHCVSMAPVWLELEKKLRGKITLIMIDADKNSQLGSAYGIQGFPTLKYFTKSTSSSQGEEYSGSRSVAPIVAYLSTK